jgi:hypothetical protein
MQRLADLADRHEGAGARLLDFERGWAAALNETDQAIEHRQRRLWRRVLGSL